MRSARDKQKHVEGIPYEYTDVVPGSPGSIFDQPAQGHDG